MPEQNKSIGWVVVMIALAVAYFGWGFLAADYFQQDPTHTQREIGFWANSLAQLANLSSVIRHGFQNRLWLVILIAVAEGGVLILWGVLKKVEKELSRK